MLPTLMARLLVVGAGPAGLSLALKLARTGQAVTLVEAHHSFARQLRGDALMPCGQEALARMGLSDLVAALPQRRLEGWSVWLERRRLFNAAEPMGSLQPCRLVPQQALLEALLAQAQQHADIQWLPGQAVRDLLHCDDRISGVQLADGRQLEADLVMACDGRQSRLRQLAGLTLRRRGQPLELLWFVLPAPVPAELVPGFLTLVAGGAIASACRGARGELQLGWLLQPGERPPQRTAQQWAEALAALAPEPLAELLRQRGGELSAPQRLTVQIGLAERWHRPGLLLLGDAAHPMSPVRAQGINMALRDSLVAAELLLAQADQGPAGLDAAAAAIERRRRPEIQRMQALQSAEARQGHWLGETALLRTALAQLAPVLGPVVRQLWLARQKPLREGLITGISSGGI